MKKRYKKRCKPSYNSKAKPYNDRVIEVLFNKWYWARENGETEKERELEELNLNTLKRRCKLIKANKVYLSDDDGVEISIQRMPSGKLVWAEKIIL